MGRVIPTCLALVLCDSVRRPSRTGEPSILHAFEFFEARSFPAVTQPFSVWMQLRDGNGPAAMRLLVEHVPSGELRPVVIVPILFTLHFLDPNAVLDHEAVFENGIHLEREGRYRLRLTANGTTIMQRYFIALRTL